MIVKKLRESKIAKKKILLYKMLQYIIGREEKMMDTNLIPGLCLAIYVVVTIIAFIVSSFLDGYINDYRKDDYLFPIAIWPLVCLYLLCYYFLRIFYWLGRYIAKRRGR